MVIRIGGMRRKSRYKLKKEIRRRGKISFSRYFQRFDSGDRVNLVLEPSVHEGMFHARFFNKAGIIKSKRGFCYEVTINDRGKEKDLIIHPVHLKKVEGA